VLVLVAGLGTELASWCWARNGPGAARKCSEICLLWCSQYNIALPPAPLVATSDLARFISRAALALARTIPLGLVVLFDELTPSSSANHLSIILYALTLANIN